MPIDYAASRELLDRAFARVEERTLQGEAPPDVSEQVRDAADLIFASDTQAYREALLGCALARLQDNAINIRLPYKKHGPGSFNGRTLDNKVVNPFLRQHRIPCSTGPYLSAFRRSVKYLPATEIGLRDLRGYAAFLSYIAELETADTEAAQLALLDYLLYRFIRLRDESTVQLARIQRISLDQYEALFGRLLGTPSGGRFPVLLAVATFLTLKEQFHAAWEVQWQGINVADAPSGAGGDITVIEDGRVMLAAEVTERVVDRERVMATFTAKIAEAGIEDYLFFARPSGDSQARRQAHQYFAQGHEINFVDLQQWMRACLATVGSTGRATFNRFLLELLGGDDVPAALKVAWNTHVTAIVAGQEGA